MIDVILTLLGYIFYWNIDGLVQDCSISIANALEIPQSCTKPSICTFVSMAQFIKIWRLKRGIDGIVDKNNYNHIYIHNLLLLELTEPSTCKMMKSSNGNIFRVTGPLHGEFTGHRWISLIRPVTRSFDAFFDLCLDKRLGKQSKRRWFEAHA